MTATFWTGSSLSFTNGSKTVTVNTGPSLDSVKANSSLTAGNYNEPVEVKSVSGNTITLYSNWPGSTGTTSATIKPSAAAAASAGVAAQQLITDIQSLVSSASATATANSFVKRDSNGRIKAASPSANDDVVTKGYLGSAATKNAGTLPGNLMEVGAFGWGQTAQVALPGGDINANNIASGAFRTDSGTSGDFPLGFSKFGTVVIGRVNSTECTQLYIDSSGESASRYYSSGLGRFTEWNISYGSKNTNFNEFNCNGSDFLSLSAAASSSYILFSFPLSSKTPPTSVSFTGSFQIVRARGLVVAATVSSLTLDAVSSSKLGVLSKSGLGSALEDGEVYWLRAVDSLSRITFNF